MRDGLSGRDRAGRAPCLGRERRPALGPDHRPGTTAVRINPYRGKPRVLVAIVISGGLRAISEETPGGLDGETVMQLAEIERTRLVGSLSPKSAAQIVQVSLYGEVRYR